MLQYQLVATNTMFMKKHNKLWTFQHPSDSKSQIDLYWCIVSGKTVF